jgi:hypothetical protein
VNGKVSQMKTAIAVLAGLAGSLLFTGAATAAAGTPYAGAASLVSVSCPQTSWCMAVGSYTTRSHVQHSLAEIWNGTSWNVLKPAGASLTGISCTATWFCLVTGGPSGAMRWNGKTFRPIGGPRYPGTAPSCGSRTLCMLINATSNGKTHNVAESWNGHGWHTWWQQTNTCPEPLEPCGLVGVSCGSASDCVAVGQSNGSPAAFEWDGTRWAANSPTALNQLTGVSCTSTPHGFCLAMGHPCCGIPPSDWIIGAAWHPATQSWTSIYQANASCPDGNNCSSVYAMSCASATSCMVFASDSGDLYWNGTTWANEPSIGEGVGSLLGAVSCHGRDCLAVGYQSPDHVQRTLAELWNGTNWQVIATPTLP